MMHWRLWARAIFQKAVLCARWYSCMQHVCPRAAHLIPAVTRLSPPLSSCRRAICYVHVILHVRFCLGKS